MTTTENSDEVEQISQNLGEWLSLGRNPTQSFKDSESQTRTKIFSCNYCMRKFYCSPALGGRQNAHRKERGAMRHYQSQRIITMMAASPVETSMIRSLVMSPHSLVHKPGIYGGAIVATYNGTAREFRNAWQTNPMGSIWPQNFRLDKHQSEQQPTHLDLNLKL